jgi:hypothetical protein
MSGESWPLRSRESALPRSSEADLFVRSLAETAAVSAPLAAPASTSRSRSRPPRGAVGLGHFPEDDVATSSRNLIESLARSLSRPRGTHFSATRRRRRISSTGTDTGAVHRCERRTPVGCTRNGIPRHQSVSFSLAARSSTSTPPDQRTAPPGMVRLAAGMDPRRIDQSRGRCRRLGLVRWRLALDHHLQSINTQQQQESESGTARTRTGGRVAGARGRRRTQVFEEPESLRFGQGPRHHAVLLVVAARSQQRRPPRRRGQRAVAGEGVGRTQLRACLISLDHVCT